ncbi:MAG TPA: hypothetical protein VF530_23935 [Planctomycetota bacterium]
MQPRANETPHSGEPPVDLDEDLFAFDQVAAAGPQADPEGDEDLERIFAELREDTGEDLFGVTPPAAAAPLVPSVPPVATHTIEPSLAPLPAPPAQSPPAAPAAAPAARPARRAPRGLVAICVAVTAMNAGVALVALRRPEPTPSRLPPEVAVARAEPAPPAPEPFRPGPETLDPVHAHPTLDQARAELARGEYSAARRRVYGLLGLVDRLEEPRRGALEVDCQFLIAQALHLEALERLGGPR